MTPRISTALFMILTIGLLCCDPPEKQDTEAKLSIEASVVVGQPVADVKVLRTDRPDEGSGNALVADAKVKMLSMGRVYELKPLEGRAGYYHYQGDDLEIVEGREYFLWVEYDDQVAVTARVVGETIPGADMNATNDSEHYVAKN